MRSSSLRWILSLALLSITLPDAHGRSLLQGGPVCDSKAVWNISSCAAASAWDPKDRTRRLHDISEMPGSAHAGVVMKRHRGV